MPVHEECGVFGMIGPRDPSIAREVCRGLYALQHRGQESCGIVVNDDGVFAAKKDLGLLAEVFTDGVLSSLPGGSMAIGHVRYATTGSSVRENVQPMMVRHQKGNLALAHNGNLINSLELRDILELSGAIFHSTSDTETICYMITRERLVTSCIEEAVLGAAGALKGAYSLVLMSSAKLLAMRDPYGFRPLCYGRRKDGAFVIASESCALEAAGASLIRDLDPGELLVFSAGKTGQEPVSYRNLCGRKPFPCIFEYIYFARPDSVIDGRNVHETRVRAGRILAREYPVRADVVAGVPDSGLSAAMGYAAESGIPLGMALVKNKYVGRSFILPSQEQRADAVRVKLSPIRSVIEGKSLVLIDDSIVRGTTSLRIVRMLREAGATEVHVRIASPPIKFPCFYGVDISTYEELLCASRTVEQAREAIEADSLAFLSEQALFDAGKRADLCLACFNGKYPTPLFTAIENANKDGKF